MQTWNYNVLILELKPVTTFITLQTVSHDRGREVAKSQLSLTARSTSSENRRHVNHSKRGSNLRNWNSLLDLLTAAVPCADTTLHNATASVDGTGSHSHTRSHAAPTCAGIGLVPERDRCCNCQDYWGTGCAHLRRRDQNRGNWKLGSQRFKSHLPCSVAGSLWLGRLSPRSAVRWSGTRQMSSTLGTQPSFSTSLVLVSAQSCELCGKIGKSCILAESSCDSVSHLQDNFSHRWHVSCKDNTSQDRFRSVKLYKEFAYRSEIE